MLLDRLKPMMPFSKQTSLTSERDVHASSRALFNAIKNVSMGQQGPKQPKNALIDMLLGSKDIKKVSVDAPKNRLVNALEKQTKSDQKKPTAPCEDRKVGEPVEIDGLLITDYIVS